MTGTLDVPEGINCTGEVDWNGFRVLLVPYSNQAVTAEPFGFTVPFRFAPSLPMMVAGEVITIGMLPEDEEIVNVRSQLLAPVE